MKYLTFFFFLFVFQSIMAQLPVKWEELTAPDFKQAVIKSGKVCVLPMGIVEKHGPNLPLGTDLILIRDEVVKAALQEYVVVFPEYYIGQINEARHQPGAIAYSPELVLKVLEETCTEIARNGFSKIILVNGHGGNNSMLSYYSMAFLHEHKDFALYLMNGWDIYADSTDRRLLQDENKKVPASSFGHAGVDEASQMLVVRPDLLRLNNGVVESGINQNRLGGLKLVTSGMDWFACYPNHYAGDAQYANKGMGNVMSEVTVRALIKAFQEVKSDQQVPQLQELFFKESLKPLETKAQ